MGYFAARILTNTALMPRRSPFRDPLLILQVLSVAGLQWFASDAGRVERWYSRGFYPPFSSGLRAALGWLPFSAGDLLYGAAVCFLAWRLFVGFRWAWRRQLRQHLTTRAFVRAVKVLLSVYLIFQVFWGLNYSRRDIAGQLSLNLQASDTALLPALAHLLQDRLCTWGDRVDSVRRLRLMQNRLLFNGAVATYDRAKDSLPFLAYRHPSIKPSLYSSMGHFFGFTGYYNPFTGEAQVHTGIPVFLRPFVTCHEMGHQLGYAKENEANFVGFLAGRRSPDADFVYSAYYEMYLYTIRELGATNRKEAFALRRTAHEQVRKDYRDYLKYLFRTRNNVEPVVMKFYDQYLRLNNQQHGIETYDEVVLWLLAYYKKYGAAAI
jgi:hypothetical protein